MSKPGVIELAPVLKSVASKTSKPVSKQAKKEFFPPVTLEAGRAQWTARDKLARLVSLAREIGDDGELCFTAELAEERALFEEISILLMERDEARQAAGFILDDLTGYRRSNRQLWERLYPWLEKRDG